MNDKNEPAVLEAQMKHLGRTPGNPLFAISQKYLTGHPKGAAGAWMLNGGLQALNSGIIPGNRNLDSVDGHLEKNDYIVYPNRSITTSGLKAFSLTSFGFGQKGAQAIVVHPRYLYAMLEQAEFKQYREKRQTRHRKAFRFFHRGMWRMPCLCLRPKRHIRQNSKTRCCWIPQPERLQVPGRLSSIPFEF